MSRKTILYVVVGFGLVSCDPKKMDSNVGEVSGTYAREYSFAVVNPESGKEVGKCTICDTIFIRKNSNGYEVSNNKWSLNDYDKLGWKNMELSEDRPLPTYQAVFDPTNNSMISELMAPLHFNLKERTLHKGKNENATYNRVQ